jgi:DNA-binding transcriptional ArsR family regulator
MLSQTFQALGDPNRQKILKDMPVKELAKSFSITLPSLSHHLNILKQAGLITSRRQGQEMIYSLNLSVFEQASKKIIKFFK